MFESHNQEKIKQEKEIQKNIFRNIDEFKSFVFYAGAGAGKTYALKESLRYLLKNKRKDLQRKTQKIICITYTNVAVNEIKRRIGKTDLVLVSTIHERMWDIIKKYKKELLLIHKEKLENEIRNFKLEINSDEKYYQTLSSDKQVKLKEIVIQRQDILKTLQTAKDYENYFNPLLPKNITRRVGVFKMIAKNIIKIEKYQNAIEKIENNPMEQIEKLKYDRFYNSDRLEDMKFSHDTLLEYAYKMIKKYEILRKVLISKYPYIFVDEFQDTHKYVIDCLTMLIDYAKENNKKFLIGYFGDAYQKIYSDGMGEEILKQENLERVEKKFNRRSAIEIINLINKFRDDGLKQETIYNDANGGKIEFTFGSDDYESVQRHIETLCQTYNFNEKNNLHVLFLTNKLIAKFGGFEKFFNFFKEFIFYNDLSSQIMSDDTTKLHKTVHYIYKVIYMYLKIKSFDILGTLLSKKDVKELTLKQYKSDIVEIIKRLNNVEKFKDILNKFIDIDYEKNYIAKKLLEKYIEYKNLKEVETFFIESLKIEEEKCSYLDNFLNLDIKVFENWYKYVTIKDENTTKDKIVYHTYHSTKGEEYNNILIIMENEIYKNSIKNYFVNRSEMNDDEFKYIRNLLYVSFSRAKKNLFVYYIDNNLNDNEKKIISDFIIGQ